MNLWCDCHKNEHNNMNEHIFKRMFVLFLWEFRFDSSNHVQLLTTIEHFQVFFPLFQSSAEKKYYQHDLFDWIYINVNIYLMRWWSISSRRTGTAELNRSMNQCLAVFVCTFVTDKKVCGFGTFPLHRTIISQFIHDTFVRYVYIYRVFFYPFHLLLSPSLSLSVKITINTYDFRKVELVSIYF